ncbi:UPF0041 domain protein [Mytilinidion resinicola]|uniref:Mitochondrial pyruvate carrier n=1 Tax=Mytilinidion resinicola TaxID=574789 RepID=A0A6A6YQT6_9PEZI|nr:UPF0041 domain protein [Mytilinidion resinicola]KAF2810374.1 UPF0041 domain protein [Mytilinidion resinicola]
MSARPSYRLFQASRAFFRQPLLRRRINTAAQPEAPAQGGIAKIWNSPVGPKTVHFWAPIMKWALVLTGVSDFYRPTESLSLTQNGALMATGAIWTRWCFVIKPRNIFLAAVNFFLFIVGTTQVTRILIWQRSQAGQPITEEAKALAVEAKDEVTAKTEEAVDAVKKYAGK